MAFQKKTWKDRITEFPTRRTLTKSDGSTELVTVARAEGTVSQEGDAFNAASMNDLEERISQANNDLSEQINSGLSSKSSDWELIGKECGATLIHEKLKTCKEILIYGGYGQIVVSAPSELFELDGGIGYNITLPANGTWYSNYSQFSLDRSAGKLVSSFVYGVNYTHPCSMRRVYVRM